MLRDLEMDECQECGGHDLEVDTDAPEGMVTDGDPVRCRECGLTGQIDCDSETPPYVNWHEEFETAAE